MVTVLAWAHALSCAVKRHARKETLLVIVLPAALLIAGVLVVLLVW